VRWARQRVERRGDHELEVALGQHLVGVFEVEHLALLGDAQLAVERVEGLSKDGAMRGPATAAHCAAAAVKHAQLDAGFTRGHVQIAMRAEDLPCGGQHAAILVRVGVAEHDLLPVAPARNEFAIVSAAPELAADGGRVAQIFNGFEERHWHQPRISAATFACAFYRDAAQPRQADHGQHILYRRCAADHVLANSLGRATLLDFGDHAEGL